jgi:aspartokinase
MASSLCWLAGRAVYLSGDAKVKLRIDWTWSEAHKSVVQGLAEVRLIRDPKPLSGVLKIDIMAAETEEVSVMMHFYDPGDQADLDRVEKILRSAGIEYSLLPEPETGLGPYQINVAEEDIPRAEELLAQLSS